MFFILSMSHDGGETWTDVFDGQTFETGQAAQAEAKRLNDYYKQSYYRADIRYRVRQVRDNDSDNFIAREQAKGHKFISNDKLPDHAYWPAWRLPHIDPDNPRQIRFFRNVNEAIDCKYTSVKMSRFFTSFCDLEIEDAEKILIELGFYEGTREFKLLRDPDEIETAYENGPRSCMNDPDEYPLGNIHPARVYGSPDLGVAVLMNGEDCMARTVCWPEKKIYGLIYGHASLLRSELGKLGYRQTTASSAWRGARLLKIYDENEGLYVCPYLDVSTTVSESRDGNYLRIAGNSGRYFARNCNGYVEE